MESNVLTSLSDKKKFSGGYGGNKDGKIFSINFKSFIAALVAITLLLVATYALTIIVPKGEYQREIIDGTEVVVEGTYTATDDGGITFADWITSPVRILWSSDSTKVLAIILFLLLIGGTFSGLDTAGILSYMLGTIYEEFNDKKYRLLAVVTLCFMLLGSVIGSFEETVPLVPVAIALAYALQWDAMVGLGMSLLAVGCGFSCAITNPFTVGVAQSLAGLKLFSGISMRILTFVLVYGLLILVLTVYAKRIEKKPDRSIVFDPQAAVHWVEIQYNFSYDEKKSRGLKCFVILMLVGVALILSSAFISILSEVIMPVIGVVFFIAGTVSSYVSGVSRKAYWKSFFLGLVQVLPAAVLILMASSVKMVLAESKCIDTILYNAAKLADDVPLLAVVYIILAVSLAINLFVPSGSAEAMLLIPLLAPLADITGISRQLVVLSFVFGDGFSDLFFPTSPILLVCLGLAGVSYTKWLRWSVLVQILLSVIILGVLSLAFFIGY